MSLKILTHIKELRFLQLTIFTAFFLVASPLLGNSVIFKILTQIFFINSLLVSLSASGKQVRLRWFLWILWGAALLFYLLASSGYAPELSLWWHGLEIASTALLLLCCVDATLSFIFQSRRIHLDTIFAAVMAYLLIAMIFAQIYAFLMIWEPGSFKFPSSAVMDSDNIFRTDLVYFSLVTIATLGYGDIVPQMGLTKMLAVVEAVTGQFYVAVLVAWLVGSFISQSLRHDRQDSEPKRGSDGRA
jgi:voltage-gated potassium channel